MKTITKIGRPMKTESILEELLMEIEATALTGAQDETLQGKVREMFKRIVKTAFYTQSVNRGLVTKDLEFNRHLLEFLEEGRMN